MSPKRLVQSSVRNQLLAGFIAVIAGFAVALAVALSGISSTASTVRSGYAAAGRALEASSAARDMSGSQRANVIAGGTGLENHEGDIATYRKAFAQIKSSGLTKADTAARRKAEQAFAAWLPVDAQINRLAAKGVTPALKALVDGRGNEASDALAAALSDYAALLKREADSAKGSDIASTMLTAGILALFALALAIAIAILLSRSVSRGLHALRERLTSLEENCLTNLSLGLEAVADGTLTVALAPRTQPVETTRADEIGKLTETFNAMLARTHASIASYEQMRERLAATLQEVGRTSSSVSAASQQMASTSEEAGRATHEIADAVTGVAQGAERQLQLVEAARLSAEEVARAVAESAQSASDTAAAAEEARSTAAEGVEAAVEASEAMRVVRDSSGEVSAAIKGLSEKSEQIGDIVHTITGIAAQTNLLALNAAIEAARAGEQGRGFAVVAEQVRTLAEESHVAAGEISSLIEAIQADTTRTVAAVEAGAQSTHDGAEVVERTRAAFEQIGDSINDINDRVTRIAAGSQQIAASAETMQATVNEVASVAEQSSASTQQVSASTEQSSASAQEVAASAQDLASSAERLNELVSHFRLEASAPSA